MSKRYNRITINTLVNIMYERLNKTVSKKVLKDCVKIIQKQMIEYMLEDKPFHVENFGTLCTRVFWGHEGIHPITGEKIYIPEYKKVVFYPHETFTKLVKEQGRNL